MSEMSTFQWVCLWVVNVPLFLLIGRLFFFEDFSDMKDCLIESINFRSIATQKGSRQYSSVVVGFWLVICIVCVNVEGYLIEKYLIPPEKDSIQEMQERLPGYGYQP